MEGRKVFLDFKGSLERSKEERMEQLSRVSLEHDLATTYPPVLHPCCAKSREVTAEPLGGEGEQSIDLTPIDEHALIVQGKLVYLQESLESIPRDLLATLRKHRIGLKQFFYGDRQAILERIRQREAQREEARISDYLKKHFDEKIVPTVCIAEIDSKAKNLLFSEK